MLCIARISVQLIVIRTRGKICCKLIFVYLQNARVSFLQILIQNLLKQGHQLFFGKSCGRNRFLAAFEEIRRQIAFT